MVFKCSEPIPAALTYAYSRRFDETPLFTAEKDCLRNKADEMGPEGYEFITLMTKEKVPVGTAVSMECSFEDNAAPLLVLAKELEKDERGVLRYGEYIEVVLWKNGINVWHLYTDDGVVSWERLLGSEFTVPAGEIHPVTVGTHRDGITVEACGQILHLHIPFLYDSFHAGFNACEGICRFYSFRTE